MQIGLRSRQSLGSHSIPSIIMLSAYSLFCSKVFCWNDGLNEHNCKVVLKTKPTNVDKNKPTKLNRKNYTNLRTPGVATASYRAINTFTSAHPLPWYNNNQFLQKLAHRKKSDD